MQGNLHPSLQAYQDCFLNSPFPRMFPRGGGLWDQDPSLMRDFRVIRDYEVTWKKNQQELDKMKGSRDSEGGGSTGLEGLLDDYIEEQGLDDGGRF